MNCPNCEAPSAPGARFCAQCGTALVPRCPSCGAEALPDARFCSQCGTPLGGAKPPATPGHRSLGEGGPAHRSLGEGGRPAQTKADTPAPVTITSAIERRHMTFMFCDLVGSTELSGSIDPEDLRDIVGAYREAAAAAVGRYEGTTAQYYGDGILVYFGFPVAHEDDGRRAVQAALEIVEAVAALNARLQTDQSMPLAVRIGIHTGLAVVGDVGGVNRTERLAMGDTPNVAARVQGVAQPNAVVISASTYELVRDYFKTERLGPQIFKGVTDPIVVYRVIGPAAVHERTGRQAQARSTGYVGRESVLAALNAAWRDAASGTGRLVVVTGEAGVGKSRLFQVFREGLASEAHHVIECFASPYHANSALYPFADMLRARLRLTDEADARVRLERVRAHLMECRADTEGALPLIAQLLGLPPDAGYSPIALHPLTQKQRTLEILLTLLLAPTERRPTLVVIEDAHWVDPTTLELAGALLERLHGSRMLVLLSARPTFHQPWSPRESLIALTVSDLSPADTERLIANVTDGKRLPREVLTMLVMKSDGNPLFVEEMTRMLLESGWLKEDERDGAYVLAGPMPNASVPTRLQDLLRARLDRMEPEARMVMQLASAVGRDFAYELLVEVLPDEAATIRKGLQQLLDAGLVFATGSGFMIKHELIKDVAYDSLLKRTRQQYHERIALALEGAFAMNAQGQPERLAQHWTRAGQPLRAAPYWLQAGQKAVASSAVEEAASHLRHGLDQLAAVPASIERDRLELDILSTLGTALTIQKGWAAPEVAEAYSRAHALSDRVGESPTLFWVLWGLWAFYLVKGDQTQGLGFAERMIQFAHGLADESLEIESDFALGLSHYYMGDLPRARTHLDRAVANYVPARHHANAFLSCQDVGVTSRSVASMVRHLQGDTAEALAVSADAIRLSNDLKHPFSQAYALGAAAWFHSYRREPEAMAQRAAETMALSQAQALGWWLLWGMIFAGRGQVDAAQPEAGIQQMEQALGMYRGVGSGMVVPYFLTQLAEAHVMHGDLDHAIARLEDARQLAAQGGELIASAEIDRLEGEIRWRRATAGNAPVAAADAAAVERLFQRALDTARRQGARLFELRAATSLARMGAPNAKSILRDVIEALPEQTETKDLVDARLALGEK